MLTFEVLRGTSHTLAVKHIRAVMNETGEEWKANRSLKNAVPVDLRPRAIARVETQIHLLCLHHSDSRRKQAIERSLKAMGGNGTFCFEIRDLMEGVNARIGSTRTYKGDLRSENGFQSRFQTALDRRPAILTLPAVEIRSVVSNIETKVSHPRWLQVRQRILRWARGSNVRSSS